MKLASFHSMITPAAVCGVLIAVPALAHDEVPDIGIRVNNNKITTWIANHDTGEFVELSRVFGTELFDINGKVFVEEPGFFGEAGTLEGYNFGFNITAALRKWDLGSQSGFAISPTDMTLENPLFGSVTTPPTHSLVSGPSFLVPGSGIHMHWEHILNANEPGIYILERVLFTDAPGVADSDSMFVVLNYGLSEAEHHAAMDWTARNLAPAPGVAVMLGLALPLLAVRRRQGGRKVRIKR